MSNFSDIIIFKKESGEEITYERLLKDIYENTTETRDSITTIVENLVSTITSPQDALLVLEGITEMMEVRVKNDDLLVKLATIIQRIIKGRGDDSGEFLPESEIEQLRKAIKEANIPPAIDEKRELGLQKTDDLK